MAYLLVDGGALDKMVASLSKKHFSGRPLEIKYHTLRDPVWGGTPFEKVFYYDAIPGHKLDNETVEEFEKRLTQKQSFLDALSEEPLFHVRTGETRGQKKQQRQKMVDVQLAVNAMSFASKGITRDITLLLNDLDFKPLVEALVDLGMRVTLWHDPHYANRDLVRAADIAVPLGPRRLYDLLTNDSRNRNPIPEFLLSPENQTEIFGYVCTWDHATLGRCKMGILATNSYQIELGRPYPGKSKYILIKDIDSAFTLLADPHFVPGDYTIELPDRATWTPGNVFHVGG